jgi:membrane associated rhomboid family serine protease
VSNELAGRTGDPSRFGTPAFYASIGRAFVAMCGVVPMLAGIEFLDHRLGGQVDALAGIRPHDVAGLRGLILAPFAHDGWAHLFGNSTPLVLLGTFVLAAGTARFLAATLFISIVSGLGVWFFTPPQYLVIGASGVIFGWLGYLLMRGIVERSLWNFGVALMVGLLYGWQLVLLLPTDERVSWQGHLFGFVGGLIAAVLLRRRREVPAPRPPAPVTTPSEERSA